MNHLLDEPAADALASRDGADIHPLELASRGVDPAKGGAADDFVFLPSQKDTAVGFCILAGKLSKLAFVVLEIEVHAGACDVLTEYGNDFREVGKKLGVMDRDHVSGNGYLKIQAGATKGIGGGVNFSIKILDASGFVENEL
jgi:hypothetical protein